MENGWLHLRCVEHEEEGSLCQGVVGVAMKLQTPSSKLQRNTKFQIPKGSSQSGKRCKSWTRTGGIAHSRLGVGAWNLKFLWNLVFGNWCFVAPPSLTHLH